jgi:hypothetical protein
MTIHEINPSKERADIIVRELNNSVRRAIEVLGTDISGYAVVVWDRRGECHSSVCDEDGPIGPNMIPMYVHDALLRHDTLVMAKTAEIVPIDGA